MFTISKVAHLNLLAQRGEMYRRFPFRMGFLSIACAHCQTCMQVWESMGASSPVYSKPVIRTMLLTILKIMLLDSEKTVMNGADTNARNQLS